MSHFYLQLSKQYFQRVFSAQMQRMKKIFKSNAKFKELPNQIQDEIIQTNGLLGLALLLARSENFSKGFGQDKSDNDASGNEWWIQNFSSVANTRGKIKHLSMKDGAVLGCSYLHDYFRVVENVR
jgi:hypothetical protein